MATCFSGVVFLLFLNLILKLENKLFIKMINIFKLPKKLMEPFIFFLVLFA